MVSEIPGGLSLELKSIELFWNRDDSMIDLRAVDVTLFESSGSSIMSSPEVYISLSVSALMSRVIALSSFELKDVQMHLQRARQGPATVSRQQLKTHP